MNITDYSNKKLDLHALYNSIGDCVCVTDKEMNIVAINEAFAKWYGKLPYQIVYRNVFEIYPDFKSSVFFECYEQTLKTGQNCTRVGYSNAFKGWFAVRTLMHEDKEHCVLIAHEIKNGITHPGYVALHDSLTSLHNRHSFDSKIEKMVADKNDFGLFVVDILKLNSVNENFGYVIGDMTIMEFAARLKGVMGANSAAYKFDSDKFAVVVNTNNKKEVIKQIEDVMKVASAPFSSLKEQFNINVSIGYVMTDYSSKDNRDYISDVEYALNIAKKKKNSYVEYQHIGKRNKNKLGMVSKIRNAFLNQEFELYYQPQIDVISKKICGAEALIRWNSSDRGMISPGEFLPIMEEFDLIEELDRYVILKAFKDCNVFAKQDIDLPVAINLSAKSMCNPKVLDFFNMALSRSGIDPRLITIEITENALIEDMATSQSVIKGIVDKGCKIAIDDFGSGYSSIGYLVRYPTNYLKIDREFVTNIHQEKSLQTIVSNLIKMSHSLGINVIAEGVEIVGEAQCLKNMGCDIIQGFLFGKPVKKEEIIKRIKEKGLSDVKMRPSNSL